jgi:hypothetical protein
MFILHILSWLLFTDIERALTCGLLGAAAVTLALSYRIRKSAVRNAEIDRSLRALVERCEALVAVCSRDGTLRYINASGTRLLGVGSTSSPETPLSFLGAPENRNLLESVVIPQALERGSWQGRWQLGGRAGEEDQELELCALSLPAAGERAPRVGLIARNVTQEHRTLCALRDKVREFERAMPGSQCTLREDALKQAMAAADAAEHAKREFLRNMSHEIRTPLNGILGMAELVLNSELTPEQRDSLHSIKRSGEALLASLSDILDFARSEEGSLLLQQTEFGLTELVGDTLRPLYSQAQKKGLELRCTYGSKLPERLIGDPQRLRQVLMSLVGNAIKFTSAGEIAVAIDAKECGVRSMLQIAVRDTGIGIPADKLTSIFEAFTQADGSMTRRFHGTGLGLAISARIVNLMGGRIWAESRLGEGSTFHFSVTLARPGAEGQAEGSDTPHALSPRKPAIPYRVLLVEDNSINQQLAAKMLSRMGHLVRVASDGAEALRMLAEGPCDVVLMDLQMPVMDGLSATAAIRRQELDTDRHLPIIALTAHALRGDRERCIQNGMDGYVSKPIVPTALSEALDDVMLRYPPASPLQPVPTPASGPDASPEPRTPVIDMASVLHRLGGDRELLSILFDALRQDLPEQFAEIRTATTERSAHALAAAAHKFKGVISNLTSGPAYSISAALEKLAREADWDGIQGAVEELGIAVEQIRTELNAMESPGQTRG